MMQSVEHMVGEESHVVSECVVMDALKEVQLITHPCPCCRSAGRGPAFWDEAAAICNTNYCCWVIKAALAAANGEGYDRVQLRTVGQHSTTQQRMI